MNIFRLRFGQMWSVGWVILIRLVVYLVIVGFLLQYTYFGDSRLNKPERSLLILVSVIVINVGLIGYGAIGRRRNLCIIISYVVDLIVLTWFVLFSGGFTSALIPYYLIILVMAPAWLPRRYTALFPSMAILCISYVGLGHLLLDLREETKIPFLFPTGVEHTLPEITAPTVVTNLLILSVLFFVVSYLAGFLSSKLLLEQRLNREMLSSIQEGVAVLGRGGNLFYCNAEFIRIFPEVGTGQDLTPVLQTVFPGWNGGSRLDGIPEKYLSERLVVTKDRDEAHGRPPVEIRVSGITIGGESSLFGLVFLVSDLSLRRRMERVEKELEKYSTISVMAAGLAHEIRNPLASLRSAVQEIGESFPPGSQNRMLTDIVIAESDRLDGVVNRFLDFSRESELRLSPIHLSHLLEDTRTLVMRDKSPRDFDVVLSIVNDPEVVADEDRLREIFLNLALNASQAVSTPGGRLDIQLERVESGGVPGVAVLFVDNGHGIGEDDLAHLFEPFFTRRSGGTGMGLALARKQVSMHGGDISAGNMTEGGAWFRIWLPLTATVARADTLVRRKLVEKWS